MKGIGGSSVDKGTEVWIRGRPGRKLGMVAVNCYCHWEKFPELCREAASRGGGHSSLRSRGPNTLTSPDGPTGQTQREAGGSGREAQPSLLVAESREEAEGGERRFGELLCTLGCHRVFLCLGSSSGLVLAPLGSSLPLQAQVSISLEEVLDQACLCWTVCAPHPYCLTSLGVLLPVFVF